MDVGPFEAGSCAICAAPRRAGEPCRNRWCGRPERAFSVVDALGSYRSSLRRAVTAYKYKGDRQWADVFARMLAAHLGSYPTWYEDIDLVVGVPSWIGVGARRDWDPVREILHRLAVCLGPQWAVDDRAIVKAAETPAMQGATWIGRQLIATGPLRQALRVPDPKSIAGARILVIDDVLTDGATLQAVARALREAGAEEVVGLVLARQTWRRWPAGGAGRPDGPMGYGPGGPTTCRPNIRRP